MPPRPSRPIDAAKPARGGDLLQSDHEVPHTTHRRPAKTATSMCRPPFRSDGWRVVVFRLARYPPRLPSAAARNPASPPLQTFHANEGKSPSIENNHDQSTATHPPFRRISIQRPASEHQRHAVHNRKRPSVYPTSPWRQSAAPPPQTSNLSAHPRVG